MIVGQAVKWVIENETDPRFSGRNDEEWIFLGSKRWKSQVRKLIIKGLILKFKDLMMEPKPCLRSMNQLMFFIWLLVSEVFSRTCAKG